MWGNNGLQNTRKEQRTGEERNKDWQKEEKKTEAAVEKSMERKKVDRLKKKTKTAESKKKQTLVPVFSYAPPHQNIRHSGGIDPRILNVGTRLR